MLDIGRQQAKDMSSGRRSTPIGIIAELIALIHRQAAQADAEAESSGLDVIILEKPADDVEARALGWPCVGAWSAMAARVMVATALPVAFVPYGAAAEAVEDVPLPRLR
ncbi:hypothetical protein [Methylosinus sp. Sm6]|uniref:hypothetical protein n=1 Tax=Methylosinus sp. Sm6 TaxID=2866948 RepID=UPI001C9986F1|nr:hypothetical protein [Methylosinus sp. Sm6]MBY6243240.1 hypothetical protein [Methylosinus sp. Sm6]